MVGSCIYEVLPGGAASGAVPIGRPIANTQVYVLDADMKPVPRDVAGELYIGGDGVARGYLGRSDVTAERFIPDPFALRPGSRLYRTGDSVRWNAAGQLEYLGRLDHQVKIRGHRIELGEVEAALICHPSVRDVVVAARHDDLEGAVLVAYVIARDDESSARELVAALSTHAREQLPDYMVPAAFVRLPALPLSVSGKVNRSLLPVPEVANFVADFSRARSLEQLLADTWADALGLERVGRDDDFFALGGHSLVIPRVIVRIRAAVGSTVPTQAFYECSTVAALAR